MSATKNKKSKVSFANSATMRLTRHINEYTPQEIQDSYYTSQDYKNFKDDVKRIVRMMEMKKAIDNDNNEYCTRGAESYTSEVLKMRSQNRLAAFFAVLDAHDPRVPIDSQWDDIAAAYTVMSMASARRAHKVGLADHQAVKTEEEEEQEQESSRMKNAASEEPQQQKQQQRFQLSWGQKNNKKQNPAFQSRKSTMFTRTRIALRRGGEIATF